MVRISRGTEAGKGLTKGKKFQRLGFPMIQKGFLLAISAFKEAAISSAVGG